MWITGHRFQLAFEPFFLDRSRRGRRRMSAWIIPGPHDIPFGDLDCPQGQDDGGKPLAGDGPLAPKFSFYERQGRTDRHAEDQACPGSP